MLTNLQNAEQKAHDVKLAATPVTIRYRDGEENSGIFSVIQML